MELIDFELIKMGAYTAAAEMNSQLFASAVTMPVLMFWKMPGEESGRFQTFDLISSAEKELFWIENTTNRFRDGYNHFGKASGKGVGLLRQALEVNPRKAEQVIL